MTELNLDPYFATPTDTRPSALYDGFGDYTAETQHFLTSIADMQALTAEDHKVRTFLFQSDGSFTIEVLTTDDSSKELADMTVTIETSNMDELEEESPETKGTPSRVKTIAKVALLLGAGLALTLIYQNSEQLTGLNADTLKQQLRDTKFSIQLPFRRANEFVRDQILGSEEMFVCNIPDTTETTALTASRCHYESVPVSWSDGVADLVDKLSQAKLVKGVTSKIENLKDLTTRNIKILLKNAATDKRPIITPFSGKTDLATISNPGTALAPITIPGTALAPITIPGTSLAPITVPGLALTTIPNPDTALAVFNSPGTALTTV